MGLTKENLITAIDYWKIEKEKSVETLEDLIEELSDNEDEIDFSRIKEMQSVSRSLDDIDLVIRRINQLLTKF